MNPIQRATADQMEKEHLLDTYLHKFCATRDDNDFLQLMDVLCSSYVWIPCNMILGDTDRKNWDDAITQAGKDIDALMGLHLENEEPIRLVPDILQSDGDYFFPVFTSEEAMGEYGENFSKMQKHFIEALFLAKNNAHDLAGIVINAFGDNFIFPKDLWSHLEIFTPLSLPALCLETKQYQEFHRKDSLQDLMAEKNDLATYTEALEKEMIIDGTLRDKYQDEYITAIEYLTAICDLIAEKVCPNSAEKETDAMPCGRIEIVKKGVTKLKVDAVVNAANTGLRQGGGVCGAIFQEAGATELTKACNAIGHCKTGNAVITPGFGLQAKYIIHAVGPIWNGGNNNEDKLLYSAYKQSLLLAQQNNCHSIAFPLISAGIFGYPKKQAWRKAIQACQDFIRKNPTYPIAIQFAVLDDESKALGEQVLESLRQGGKSV